MAKRMPAKLTRLSLREDYLPGFKCERVDREAGVIKGVKILGRESRNRRRYTPEAVVKAIPLYEGVQVCIDHPAKPGEPRKSRDVFGRLINVREVGGELWGDLEYLKSHPMAASVCEAAERMPGAYGLSHNAEGNGEHVDGVHVIREICDVRSVDLVAEPATNNGLFEGKHPMKLKAYFEAAQAKLKGNDRKYTAANITRLLEADVLDPDMDMPADAPAPDADPAEALRGGFEASCLAVIQQSLSGEMDPAAALAKLKEMLTTHSKLTSEPEPEEPVEEEDCSTDDEKDKKMESRIQKLEAENAAYRLCESMDIKPGKGLMAALVALPDDKARKALLEETKAAQPQKRGEKTRTQIPEGKDGSTPAGQIPKGGEAIGKWLTSGV